MHATATLHIHPALASPTRIFEIRRLAQEHGCTFIAAKPKPKTHHKPAPFNPDNGGHAA